MKISFSSFFVAHFEQFNYVSLIALLWVLHWLWNDVKPQKFSCTRHVRAVATQTTNNKNCRIMNRKRGGAQSGHCGGTRNNAIFTSLAIAADQCWYLSSCTVEVQWMCTFLPQGDSMLTMKNHLFLYVLEFKIDLSFLGEILVIKIVYMGGLNGYCGFIWADDIISLLKMKHYLIPYHSLSSSKPFLITSSSSDYTRYVRGCEMSLY